jgi:hypothetical protein
MTERAPFNRCTGLLLWLAVVPAFAPRLVRSARGRTFRRPDGGTNHSRHAYRRRRGSLPTVVHLCGLRRSPTILNPDRIDAEQSTEHLCRTSHECAICANEEGFEDGPGSSVARRASKSVPERQPCIHGRSASRAVVVWAANMNGSEQRRDQNSESRKQPDAWERGTGQRFTTQTASKAGRGMLKRVSQGE